MNKTLEERLDELTERLNFLTIQQDNINEQVTHTRRELGTIITAIRDNAEEVTETEATVTKERVSAVAGSGYYIGDKVVITNPSKGQKNQGTVTGETRDGLLKIQPTQGKHIRRLPKNVRKDECNQRR